MSATIRVSNFKGLRGQIYIARKGAATIICLDDGRNFRVEPCGQTATPVVDAYWVGSIEWRAGYSSHYAFGILRTALPAKHRTDCWSDVPNSLWEKLEILAA